MSCQSLASCRRAWRQRGFVSDRVMGLLDFGAENHTGVFAKAVSKGERVQLHEAAVKIEERRYLRQ